MKKRADGLYVKKLTIDGKQIFVYGKTQREVAEKVQQRREEIAKGLVIGNNVTLDAYYKVWKDGRRQSVSEATQAAYDDRYKSISKYIGSVKIKDITAATVRKLQQQLLSETVERYVMDENGRRAHYDKRATLKPRPEKETAKRYSTQGVNIRITTLGTILKSAAADRLIPFNPVSNVKGIKRTEERAVKTIHRALTDDELRLFLSFAEGNTMYCNLMRLLLCTGMRCGEAAALRWCDIDRKGNCIHVTRTVSRSKDENGKNTAQIVDSVKTESSYRDVPLTAAALKAIEAQRAQNEMMYGHKVVSISQLIFTKKDGSIISAKDVDDAIDHITARIVKSGQRMERFAVHGFRDTFATMCVNQGMKPQTLQKILGHSSISITMNLYYHTFEEQKQEEMSRIVIPF